MGQGPVQEHWFGPHRVRFEPPDRLYLDWNGEVTPEHLQCLSDLVASIGQRDLLVVNDLSRSGIPSARTRKFAVQDERLRLIRAMAIVGASYPVRVVTNLIHRAASFLLGPQPMSTRFVETEAEALAWLDAQRAQGGEPAAGPEDLPPEAGSRRAGGRRA
jgi:hypothetical protein